MGRGARTDGQHDGLGQRSGGGVRGDGDDLSAGLGVVGVNGTSLERGDQGQDRGIVLVALLDGDDVGVGLGGVTGGVLDGESVGDVEAAGQGVVVVDDADGALIGILELGGDGLGVHGGDLVAAVVHDVEHGHAVIDGGVLGQGDQTLLLEQEQGAGAVGIVAGDDDGGAVGQLAQVAQAVGIDAEGLIVDLGYPDQVGAVGLVEAVEIGGVLEVVGVEIAVLQGGVGQNVVVIDHNLQVVALLGQLIFDQLKDLGVGRGARADDEGSQICRVSGLRAGESDAQSKQSGKENGENLFHGIVLLIC